MRKKLKLLLVAATLALTIGIISLGGGVVSAPAKAAGSGTLEGFTSSGASVYIATDGTDVRQMRFQIDLTADKAAYAGAGKTAGVVYIPLDVYKVNGVTELTKDTPSAITADVTKNWSANADGSYSSYAYLDSRFIPAGQENRTLVARGYIVDGENVYYTDEVKASMAYVAWKNIDMEDGKYADQLKKYMGPYTLTYGDDGKIENLYYGDTFTLPTSIGTDTVDKWYWDLACTQEIKPTDYATGSMKIYYELRKVEVSGTIACAASSVDLTKTEIYANGKKIDATIDASGNYTVNVSIKNAYDLVFKNGNYIAYGNVTVGENAVYDVNATLKPNTFDIGNFGSVKSSTDVTYDKNAALDGSVSVGGSNVMLVMPNTAKDEAFAYEVKVSNVTRTNDEATVGICITDGKNRLAVGCRRYDVLEICMGANGGEEHTAFYGKWQVANTTDGATLRFEVKKDEICFYVNGALRLTFTKDSITPNGVDYYGNWGDSLKGVYGSMISGFFADNAKIAVGINSGWKFASTATYNYSIIDMQTVTGTVSAPSGSSNFDLTEVKIYADDKLTDATVSESGAFSLVLPEGTHNFSFETEGYIAYADGVTVGKNTDPITATLADNTFAIGKHGSITSTTGGYDRTDALDGSVTVEKQSGFYTLVMPNTATTEEKEYTVTMSDLYSKATDYYFGFGLSNGTKTLAFTFNKDYWFRVTPNGYGAKIFGNTKSGADGKVYKLVRTKSEIKLFIDGDLIMTVTKDGIITSLTGPAWGDENGGIPATAFESFFGDNVSLAFAIVTNGTDGASKRTYSYSVGEVAKASGTISKPDAVEDIDLTSVKVYANGTDTRATVSADGKFSFTHIAGTYDISFATPDYGYVAYADATALSATTAPINVNLLDGTYAIGNYGKVKSSTNVTYDKTAALTGTVTVSGNASSYVLAVPNLATSEPVQFNIKVSDKAYTGSDGQMNEQYYGFGITNGTDTLRFVIGRWQALGVNVGNISKTYGVSTDLLDGFGMHPKDCKIVCTSEKIELYIAGNFILGWTADGITAGWAGVESNAELNAAIASKFLGGDKKLTITLDYFINAAVTNHAATYTYSANKLYTVSGTLASAEGVDLTATTLTIDGAATPITVGSDGKYTLLVPEGERKFVFSNGNLGATVVKTITDGENVVDVTAWTDYTWAVGNYGTVKSTQTPDLNQSGVYTVSGQNELLVMPNTATSGAFTFSVALSDIEGGRDQKGVGIALTNGTNVLSVELYQWETIVVNLGSSSSPAFITYFDDTNVSQYWMGTLKFVVTSDKIELYYSDGSNEYLYFTFTSESCTPASSVTNRGWGNNLDENYAANIAGFFADGRKLACGIAHGINGATTATYTCSITKN